MVVLEHSTRFSHTFFWVLWRQLQLLHCCLISFAFWQIENHDTLIRHSQKFVQCCFADCCLVFCRLLDVHRNSLAQALGQPQERLTSMHQPNLMKQLQELFNKTESVMEPGYICQCLCFSQWLSDLVVMLDITHLGYMKEHITTTLPNKSLKPAGIEDSWMEKWNNPVWCFHLQAGR